jgi:uncharacterized protein (DUF433 family)
VRIRVIDTLDHLAAGQTPQQILSDFPDLEPEDITAALRDASRRLDHLILAA